MRSCVPFVLSCTLGSAACSSESEAAFEGIRFGSAPIINGTADSTHKAVVVLALGNGASTCTGTIIQVEGTTGHVLTAAHCVNDSEEPPTHVLYGQDASNPSKVWFVSDYAAHPNYNGEEFDMAMVTFSGASSTTPVSPYLPKALDTMKAGSEILFVGYGVTESSDDNSERLQVSGTIYQENSKVFSYDQADGGPCSGDSGGPAFFTAEGEEYVAGVTSYGDENCSSWGVSTRVSAGETFINGYISGDRGSSSGGSGTSSGAGGAPSGAGGSDSAGGATPTENGSGGETDASTGGLGDDEDRDDGDAPRKNDTDTSFCAATPISDGSFAATTVILVLGISISRRRRAKSGKAS